MNPFAITPTPIPPLVPGGGLDMSQAQGYSGWLVVLAALLPTIALAIQAFINWKKSKTDEKVETDRKAHGEAIDQLRKDMDDARARVRTLEDANQKLTVQVIDLTGRLAASDAMAKHLTDRNTELEDEVKALDKEVKELRQEVYEWRTGTRKITNSQQGTQ